MSPVTSRPRSRRVSRARREKRRQDALGVAVLVAVAFIGIALLSYWWRRPAVHLIATTLCPEGGPAGVVVAVLDRSDPLNVQQREGLHNRLVKLRDDLPIHERLDIYVVGDTSTS